MAFLKSQKDFRNELRKKISEKFPDELNELIGYCQKKDSKSLLEIKVADQIFLLKLTNFVNLLAQLSLLPESLLNLQALDTAVDFVFEFALFL
ncbi:hypothetical protein BpHYR1_033072 [Brachionus plicatilis]|uniref:Uncharacterized protein n=1 Tax=Brachionus plicatilis TaxID=10195 RepID=A0A3M7RI76_BRAPC|nr:hypothetical protein BpHYR1_033072 [Brachionus plicatilis]